MNVMQHNNKDMDILFLYSISQQLVEQAEEERFPVFDYIEKIGKNEHVELLELKEDALLYVNQFKYVVFLAHHDYEADSLVLADGTFLPLNKLIGLLPANLAGKVVLDFAICRSTHLAQYIKRLNTNYSVFTANEETDLKLRLSVYLLLFEHLQVHPETNYREAYDFCLDKLKCGLLKRQKDKEGLRSSVTKLGGDSGAKTSVYAPHEFVCGETFCVWVYIHYDVDTGMRLKIIQNHDKKQAQREHNITLKNHNGDILTLRIDFLDGTRNPTDLIRVGDKQKIISVPINEEKEIKYTVFVAKEYPFSKFWLRLRYFKGNECLQEFSNDVFYLEERSPSGQYIERLVGDAGNGRNFGGPMVNHLSPEDGQSKTGNMFKSKRECVEYAMKEVVKQGKIKRKLDWAAIYKVLNEKAEQSEQSQQSKDSGGGYSCSVKDFVDIVKSIGFDKNIEPTTESVIHKFLAGFNKKRYPKWEISKISKDDRISDFETERLVKIAETFLQEYNKCLSCLQAHQPG
ncbi:MAG: hypothetical protein IJP75_11715 [Bacteroidaceae bacterium]|nr:hypothetical protein [Bacteroidaceae bacterium]